MSPTRPAAARAGAVWAGAVWARAAASRNRLADGPAPGLRTAKLAFAAVLAFVLATRFDTSPDRILAPLTALLVVQLTLYETVAHGLGRVVSVLAGVLVAVGVAHLAGLTWWSLGAVVLAALVVGQLLRLGEHLLEVPISAMIILALGGTTSTAVGRVYETLIGAAVGLGVNLLIAPPLHVQPAQEAVGRLAARLAEFVEGLAQELRAGWSRAAADRWLDRARALSSEVERADRNLEQAERSARFNPRGGRARGARPRLRTGLTALEHCHVSLRNLCRALLDRAYFVPEDEQHLASTAGAGGVGRRADVDRPSGARRRPLQRRGRAGRRHPRRSGRQYRRAAGAARPPRRAPRGGPFGRPGGLAAARGAAGRRRPAEGGSRSCGTSPRAGLAAGAGGATAASGGAPGGQRPGPASAVAPSLRHPRGRRR